MSPRSFRLTHHAASWITFSALGGTLAACAAEVSAPVPQGDVEQQAGPITGPGPDPVNSESGELCDLDQPGIETRPRWSQIGEVPDYERVSTNLNINKSMRLVSSTMDKAITKIGDVRSELEEIEATGTCDCVGNEETCDEEGNPCATVLHPPVAKADCAAACEELADAERCEATGAQQGWQTDDLYYGARNTARKAIEHVDFLDKTVAYITSDDFGDKLAAAQAVSTKISNATDFLDDTFSTVDQFTEGFHLGAYSEQRPDLWACVPRAGSGVYARMGDLGGGRFSIGSRYTSGLAAKKVNGVFSMGAASLDANGRSYPFMPGVNYNLQINGFELFHKNSIFGIPVGTGGIPVAGAEQVDVFNLMPDGAAAGLDASGDGLIGWGELFHKGFYPISYTSGGQQFEWPRAGVDDYAPENKSVAVFGAGLDLKLEMERKSWSLRPIPLGGFGSITPKFTLDAGVAWHNEHNRVLDRIEHALDIAPAEHDRDMHALQAPDASSDVGVSAHVDPRVEAELTLGKKWLSAQGTPNEGKRWKLELGVFASMGLKLAIRPSTIANTIDTSRGLATFLGTINPDPALPCEPVLQTPTPQLVCANSWASEATQAEIASLSCSPDKCTSGGVCVGGSSAALRGDASGDPGAIPGGEAECLRAGGTWHPNVCGTTLGVDADGQPLGTQIVGWQGPGCSALSSDGQGGYLGPSAAQAAQLAAALADDAAPRHSIFTYAMSDLTFEAILDASVRASMGFRLRIFGKTIEKNWTLFDWRDAWSLGSTNKTWFQQGLEAQYDDECGPSGPVINHQPDRVTRYPRAGTARWEQFDTADELVSNWCEPSVAADSTYNQYGVPTNDGLVDSIKSYTDMGSDVGEQTWESSQLCVGGQLSWDWAASGLEREDCAIVEPKLVDGLTCANNFAGPSHQPQWTCDFVGGPGSMACQVHGVCVCESGNCGFDRQYDVPEAMCDAAPGETTWVANQCQPAQVPAPGEWQVVESGACAELTTMAIEQSGCLKSPPSVPGLPAPMIDGHVDLDALTDADGNLRSPYSDNAAWTAWAGAFAACMERAPLEVMLACELDGTCAPEACCGDGILEDHEPCDASAGAASPGECTDQCTLVTCGDDRLQGSEECDDGNALSGDGCSSTCEREIIVATGGTEVGGAGVGIVRLVGGDPRSMVSRSVSELDLATAQASFVSSRVAAGANEASWGALSSQLSPDLNGVLAFDDQLAADQADEHLGLSFTAVDGWWFGCSDGVDNDGDGLVDYPADPDCFWYFDNEGAVAAACNAPTAPVTGMPAWVTDGTKTVNDYVMGATVANGDCGSSAGVAGLTRQILHTQAGIARAVGTGGMSMMEFKNRTGPKLTLQLGGNAVSFVQKKALLDLYEAIDADAGDVRTYKISSAYRPPSQQILFRAWYKAVRCGYGPNGTKAGQLQKSNHGSAGALDIPGHDLTFRDAMAGAYWDWYGDEKANEDMHFDYEGGGIIKDNSGGVRAFQYLWNINMPPQCWLAVDGQSGNDNKGSKTYKAVLASPKDGFPTWPQNFTQTFTPPADYSQCPMLK
jgi:cysteine-rich repeat protein